MKSLIIVFLCFLSFHFVYSQSDSTQTATFPSNEINYSLEVGKSYRAWVYTKSQYYPIPGYLYKLNDSSITVIPRSKNYVITDKDNFQIADINQLRFRKKGKVSQGLLIGAVSGLVLGGFMGLSQGDNPCNPNSWCILRLSAEAKAVLIGVPMSVIGLTVGGLASGLKIQVKLDGTHKTYQRKKQELQTYMLR